MASTDGTNERAGKSQMNDEVIIFRIRMTPEPHIRVALGGLRCPLGDREQVQEAVHRYFDTIGDASVTGRPTATDLIRASQELQAALFPDNAALAQLAVRLADSEVVKVIADDDDAHPSHWVNQIPWELLIYDPDSTSGTYERFWGYHHVFLRTCTKNELIGRRQDTPVHPLLKAGILNFDAIPCLSQIGQQLVDLAENPSIRLIGCTSPRSHYKADDLPRVFAFLKGLDIIHLSCLIVRFKYSEQAFLVLSDAFLISLDDIKNDLRFDHSPLIFLDAYDNTWHLMEDRFDFLSSLIVHGGGEIVTCFPPVPQDLATAFSQCFYQELAQELAPGELVPVPRVLLNARRVLLKQRGNLLALLFWLYGNPWSEVPRPLARKTLSQSSPATRCDRGKLCDIIDERSTDQDVRKFQQAMRSRYDRSEFRSYEGLRGSTKWDKIDHLLEIWETLGNLCEACRIYGTEIRPKDEELTHKLQSICPHRDPDPVQR